MKKLYLIVSFCIVAIPACCQWNNNPSVNNIVSNSALFETSPQIISDGANGSIIFFNDIDSFDLYAQKITSSGTIAWGTSSNPVAICTAINWQFNAHATPDGSGGAFVTWTDYRFDTERGEIYIQHINSAGVPVWGANGLRVTNLLAQDDNQSYICVDGAGGVIVTWTGDNKVNNIQSYAQRYNSAGVAQWATNGVQICTAPGFRGGNGILADGSNGAIIFFIDSRNDPHGFDYPYVDTNHLTNTDLFAQRVNGSGTTLWASNGVAISTAAGNQQSSFTYNTAISDGGGGAIIVFDDGRNDIPDPNGAPTNNDIFAQRVNSSGVPQWTANGVALTTGPFNQYVDAVSSDGLGGIVAVFDDSVSGTLRSQRVTSAGAVSWAAGGIAITSQADVATGGSVSTDGLGNYIYCYSAGDFFTAEIKAQKLNASGVKQWAPTGVTVCNATFALPSGAQVTRSDNGSVIATWSDFRNFITTNNDIFASKILSDGTLSGAGASNYITAANGNWNNPGTWTGGAIPPAGATVIVRHNVTVNVNASCYSVTVELPSGSVTVGSGIQLTVTH